MALTKTVLTVSVPIELDAMLKQQAKERRLPTSWLASDIFQAWADTLPPPETKDVDTHG